MLSRGRVLFRSRVSVQRSVRQETILEDAKGQGVLRIDPHFYLARPAYDVLRGGTSIPFRTASVLRRVYSLADGTSPLTIYAHRNLKPCYSVFLAGHQVAAILRKPMSILEGDTFTIFLEPTVDPSLVVAIALILDRIGGQNHNLLRWHGPASILEARRFDEAWLERAQKGAA